MAYTTASEIRKVMRKLPTSITDQELEDYAVKATVYINGTLGKSFFVPFEEPLPQLLKYLATDLAVYFLTEDLYTSQQPNLDEFNVKRWERIEKTFEMILSGEYDIGVPMKPDTSTNQAGFATTNETPNIFTLEDPFW